MKNWSPQFAIKFWGAHPDSYYLGHVREKYNIFNIDNICAAHFKNNSPKVAIDIGGGKLGGALYWYDKAKESYLVDLLADEFKEMNKIPSHVETVKADFNNLPFKDDSVDVIFIWETLDHSLTEEHFKSGLQELKRVLRKGGLLFFQHVKRQTPRAGHTIIVGFKQIINWLDLTLYHYKRECRDRGDARLYFLFGKD